MACMEWTLCSSRRIGERRERGMEGGRKGSRQRRRALGQLKIRCLLSKETMLPLEIKLLQA